MTSPTRPTASRWPSPPELPGRSVKSSSSPTADGSLQGDLVRTGDSVFAVAYSPDGKKIAAAGADRAIRVYDLATGKQLLAIEDHADWVMDVAWTPDGKKLASASRDKTSKVFDATTGDSPGHLQQPRPAGLRRRLQCRRQPGHHQRTRQEHPRLEHQGRQAGPGHRWLR